MNKFCVDYFIIKSLQGSELRFSHTELQIPFIGVDLKNTMLATLSAGVPRVDPVKISHQYCDSKNSFNNKTVQEASMLPEVADVGSKHVIRHINANRGDLEFCMRTLEH